ncbi:hypothetical protein BGX28_000102 [Mortierella sp. GBA30]|nr:hypothetical protein BGX28_000102 [Mortierella sp. GBA30]
MVKLTTFLLASVAIMACSTSAQISTKPRAISAADFESYTAVGVLAAEIPEVKANVDNGHLMRRGEPTQTSQPTQLPQPTQPTRPKPKQPKQPKPKQPQPKKPHPKKPQPKKPQPKKPTTPSASLTQEQQLILDTHNKYRAKHQAPPLTWNDNAANFGNNWIQQCQFKHSGGPHGENLAAGYKDFGVAIDAWYNEVKMYDYNRPGFTMQTGHFTQVVWKDTKSVGCAKKFCPSSNWYIYICEYDPPGNVVSNDNGYFRKNVLPPTGA